MLLHQVAHSERSFDSPIEVSLPRLAPCELLGSGLCPAAGTPSIAAPGLLDWQPMTVYTNKRAQEVRAYKVSRSLALVHVAKVKVSSARAVLAQAFLLTHSPLALPSYSMHAALYS